MNKTFHIIASLLVAMLLLSGESWAEDKQPSPVINEEYEMDSWTSAKEINTIEAYEVYLAEYANGRHAKFAQAAINKIKKAENPKGSEESSLPRAKDAGDGAAKQPAAAAPPAPAGCTPPHGGDNSAGSDNSGRDGSAGCRCTQVGNPACHIFR